MKAITSAMLWLGVSWTYLVVASTSFFLHVSVLVYMWNWFVVKVGAKPIGFPLAAGLWLTIAFVVSQYYGHRREDVAIEQPIAYLFVRPIVTLLLGFLVHLAV